MEWHFVCAADELPAGSRKIVRIGRVSVGVFNVEGRLYAIRNICPHHGAELCLGNAAGTMAPSAPGTFECAGDVAVVRCPRHRWEFDLDTGRSVAEPERWRVKAYDVELRDGDVMVAA